MPAAPLDVPTQNRRRLPNDGESLGQLSLYDDRHSFVWKHGAGLLDLLDPKPGERVLDLGCAARVI